MRERIEWRGAALAAVAALGLGCAGDEVFDDEEEVGASTEEIRGGRARDDHPEIAQAWLHLDGEWGFCTATLVDRQIAITAGHCVNYHTNHKKANYGYLEVKWKSPGIDTILTTRYRINGIHNFDEPPREAGHDFDDIGLIRLATAVPCEVAKPAKMARNPPPVGTIITRWGYGGCDGAKDRKRARHLRRGAPAYTLCPGDSGGPSMDANAAVYAVNEGHDDEQDGIAWVGKSWGRIQKAMDQLGRKGGCN